MISPALLATILSAMIIGYLLFIKPINGLGDDGDFYRSLYSNGLYPLKNYSYFGYVIQHYGIMQYFNEHGTTVFSSQALLIKIAIMLNKIFYSTHVFDIRFLALIYYLLYLGGICYFVKSLTTSQKNLRDYFLALLVVLIFADSAFTLYFNSFYQEPILIISMLYVCASFLTLVRGTYKYKALSLVGYFVSVLFFIFGKQQNAPLVVSFIIISLGLLFICKSKRGKVYLGSALLLLLVAGALSYSLINNQFSEVNQYQSFTHGVLLYSKNPGERIKRQGINAQYSLMRNQNYYNKFEAIQPSSKYIRKHLLNKFNFVWIIKYYINNFKQFRNLLDAAAKNIMNVQVRAVGDYVKDKQHNRAGKQIIYFTLYSKFMETFFPKKFAFLILLVIIYIMVYLVGLYNSLVDGKSEGIMRFFLIAGLMSMVVIVPIISIIGDGDADLAKHLFVAPICLDFSFIILISDILNHKLWHA